MKSDSGGFHGSDIEISVLESVFLKVLFTFIQNLGCFDFDLLKNNHTVIRSKIIVVQSHLLKDTITLRNKFFVMLS